MDFKEYSENIKFNLTMEQIEELLIFFKADPVRKGDLLISRTICHNGDSHKLYYYENTHLFRCFTECSDIFDIFELIIKIKQQENIEFSLGKAVSFVAKFFNIEQYNQIEEYKENELDDWKIINKYKNNSKEKEEEKIVELKIYDNKILKYLPKPRITPWEKEGITKEVINYCEICFNPVSESIVIPHYDIDNNLIGIRERTLIKENEVNGKYKPAILNYKMYNHPLGFSLYGLNWSKDNIKKIKKVIVFEGEKSVLLYQSYFGIKNNISVAVCGSSITKHQIKLLKECMAEEICIAFDKQFKEIGDDEWKGWTKKLKEIHKKYGNEIKISFLFDKWNMLDYKMSPIDNGLEIFMELFKRRVSL